MTEMRKTLRTPLGAVSYLEGGTGAPLVLLHGIGSGAASWTAQIEAFSDRFRVIAWDAPGYGKSDQVSPDAPAATDYAAHLAGLLDALNIPACHLVGHSLGAIVGCGFARIYPGRVTSLMIAAPATGYGKADLETQNQRRAGRMSLMNELGPKGLARERHSNLLSEKAPRWARDKIQDVMAQLRPEGYKQAVELLVKGDLKADAAEIFLDVTVVVGDADTITPPVGCKAVADSFQASSFKILPDLGHACYVEGPGSFNAVLDEHLRKSL